MLESVATLSAEELERPAGGSFGSIAATLAHLAGAEWVYVERCRGRSPRALPDIARLDALRKGLGEAAEAWRDIVGRLDDAALDRPLSYVNFAGETWTYRLEDLLRHVVNHSTYHRGQVAFLLRQLGKKALGTDYLLYFDLGAGEGEVRRE